MRYLQLFYALIILFCSFPVMAQNIFSEKDFEYKKTLLPYDVVYTFALEDKQFVMLREEKKNLFKLGRYDQYFFELWEKDIEFDAKQDAPQIFIKGDSIVTYQFTQYENDKLLKLTFNYYSLESGSEIGQNSYDFSNKVEELPSPFLTFSDNHSKFVVQNISTQEGKLQMHIFELGQDEPVKVNEYPGEALPESSKTNIRLSDNGDLLMAVVDANSFKIEANYWSINSSEVNRIESNFFLERPADQIENIDIIRQGASSYFISFSAKIEDELIGFGVLGVNVILKTVMFSHNQNFNTQEIAEVYDGYYVTSENQKKKKLALPETLDQFQLVRSFTNDNNDIILAFEELEVPIDYHQNGTFTNKPWKHKSKEDKFYFGGDLILYGFSVSGQVKWKKVIQKSQYSQANSLGLSFIPRLEKNTLDLLCYEVSKGGNFYVLSINTSDGSLINKTNLLPDKKIEFAKRYSCWLNTHAVILLGIAPANINKRTLMLVEF